MEVMAMFKFVTGDLLKSDAYAIVNTVNCEGYMGKGIAYQFKLRFPEMNLEYERKCKSRDLYPGKLHCYNTGNKLIINFPTKDKWREKSKMEYIVSGLDELVKIIKEYNITSIAIPPLGSGNGGLIWSDVKREIIKRLKDISDKTDIYVYEPSQNYKPTITIEPKLSLSALILMQIKFKLKKERFDKIGLQKTAYFMNILSNTEFFHFEKAQYGPFAHSIEVIIKNINEFQQYYGVKTTNEAYDILKSKIVSKSVQDKLDLYIPFIEKAASFTNHFETTTEVEGAGTALFIIQKGKMTELNEIIRQFKNWSEDKEARFSEENIKNAVSSLEEYGFIENTLCGYKINCIDK